jgi:hypothetical protein
VIRHRALLACSAATAAIAAAYLSAFFGGATGWGAWLMVVGVAVLVVGLMVLGAVRSGDRVGALRIPLLFTFLVIVGAFGAALVLPAVEGAGARLLLGLPVRAAIVLYGIAVLPLIVLPLTYAVTFDRVTLREEDLERVRSLRRARDAARDGDDPA